MSDPRKKFKSKVLVIFFLISFLPVLAIAASNLYLVIKTRQQNIIELQVLAIENLGEKMAKFLEQKIENLNMVVTGNIISINELPANSLYFLLFNSFAHSQPNSLELVDEKGYIVAKMQSKETYSFSRDYLARFNQEEVLFQDGRGKLITKSDLRDFSRIEAYVGDSSDHQAAVRGESYFGPIEFIDDRPVMRLAAQVRNGNNAIIGSVSAEIDLSELDRLASGIVLGEEGYLYVLDSAGNVIASGNKQAAKIGDNFTDIDRISRLARTPEPESHFADNLTGRKIIVSGRTMEKLGWQMINEWPIRDAFRVIGNILYGSFLASLAILALVIIVSSYFTGKIVKPIKTLAKGAREISAGNLDHQIELKTDDEFETLAVQFNEMINILKENRKLRDEFVFIAAHELRTPVTAIRGYLSMILDGTFGRPDPVIAENLKIIQGANDRLVQLVQDLLQVARSEAGKMKLEMKPVDIAQKVSQVISELRSLSEAKGIKIDHNPALAITVMADEYKLNEVLVNIIGNAIKYTLDKGSIEISHERRDDKLITHIKDHGLGMSSEQMDKLFGKFYRIQTDATRNIEGTGLGLFICKQIIEGMQGEIWVKSEEGKGSTFSFSLKIDSKEDNA